MTSSTDLWSLYEATRCFTSATAAAATFLPSPLPETPVLRRSATPGERAPGVDLAAAADRTVHATAAVTRALYAAADALHWRQSYSEAQVGAAFLHGYGWAQIAGPEGPFVFEHARVVFCHWGPKTAYPTHAHSPEEVYLPLSGSGLFTAEGRAPEWAHPGDSVFHASNVPHATHMGPAGLLTLVLWRGAGLALDQRLLA